MISWARFAALPAAASVSRGPDCDKASAMLQSNAVFSVSLSAAHDQQRSPRVFA